MPLIRELKPGDILRIGDIEIVAEPKNGKAARLKINTSLPIQHTRAGATPAHATPEAPATEAPEAAPPPRPKLFRPSLA